MEGDISSGTCGIAYRDTTGFLAPVLEGQKAVIDGGRGIFPGKVIDPEDPAGLFDLVLWIQFRESRPPLYGEEERVIGGVGKLLLRDLCLSLVGSAAQFFHGGKDGLTAVGGGFQKGGLLIKGKDLLIQQI